MIDKNVAESISAIKQYISRGFDTVDCNKCRSECPMRDGIL